MKIKSIKRVESAPVYNLEVEDTHDFIIQGGVVSHNCADSIRYVMMSRPIEAPRAIKPKEIHFDPLESTRRLIV